MFNFPNPRQRAQEESFSPSVQYRQQDYYLNNDVPTHMSLPTPENPSRHYAGDSSRPDFYPQTSREHLYSNVRQTSNDGLDYMNVRGSHSPVEASYVQSQHRRSSTSSDVQYSPSHSYQGHQFPGSMSSSQLPVIGSMRRNDSPTMLENLSIPAPHTNGTPELSSAITGPPSDHSVESDFWQNLSPEGPQPEPAKQKKSRREKPRIELAPDQPPTTQGKPRARVYVACLQWQVISPLKALRTVI